MSKLSMFFIACILLLASGAQAQEKRYATGLIPHDYESEINCYRDLLKANKGGGRTSQTSEAIRRDTENMIENLRDSKDGLIPGSMVALNSCAQVQGKIGESAKTKAQQFYPSAKATSGGGSTGSR